MWVIRLTAFEIINLIYHVIMGLSTRN